MMWDDVGMDDVGVDDVGMDDVGNLDLPLHIGSIGRGEKRKRDFTCQRQGKMLTAFHWTTQSWTKEREE